MLMSLNREVKTQFSGCELENAAYVRCQETALKIAEELMRRGQVCAWVEKVGLIMWVAPYEGRLQLFTSSNLRSNTPLSQIKDAEIDLTTVDDFASDDVGFDECTEAFAEWLMNPVIEDKGAHRLGCMAVAAHENWMKAYEELKKLGWAETGSGVITKTGSSTIFYGWSTIIRWHLDRKQQEKQGMSSYMITVSENGKFLFRTEEQPGGLKDADVSKVVEAVSAKFPKSEGYEVILVEWPEKAGTMKDVSQ